MLCGGNVSCHIHTYTVSVPQAYACVHLCIDVHVSTKEIQHKHKHNYSYVHSWNIYWSLNCLSEMVICSMRVHILKKIYILKCFDLYCILLAMHLNGNKFSFSYIKVTINFFLLYTDIEEAAEKCMDKVVQTFCGRFI